jgi:hypothetical protein
LGKILDFFGLGSKEAKEAKEVKEKAKEERGSFFKEMIKGFMLRQFPKGSAIWDLMGATGIVDRGPEMVPWQHEFETLTAILRFTPDFLKHYITDIFAKSDIFQWLVAHWPLADGIDLPLIGPNGKLTERVKAGEPDAIVEALRIIHQDVFVTGKVTFDKLKDLMGGSGSALAVMGGGAAALVGGKDLLEGKNPLEGITGSDTTGKKLEEIIKAHPEAQQTTMNKNLLSLLNSLGVTGTATVVKGDWLNNNDEVTVSYNYNNGKYFLIYDNDVSSTDITVKNDQGMEIANFTDWGGLDSQDDAEKITTAMKENPSKTPVVTQQPQPANDNGTPAQKAAA